MKIKFQERLKDLRKNWGLSQMGLSEATGISQSAIAKCDKYRENL